jgi:hypothetical protein
MGNSQCKDCLHFFDDICLIDKSIEKQMCSYFNKEKVREDDKRTN